MLDPAIPNTLTAATQQPALQQASGTARHSKITDKNSALLNTPAGRKLQKATSTFESLLISDLYKSMKSSFVDSDDSDSLDAAHDSLDDWSIQTMSEAIGKAGGLGLGNVLLQALLPKLEHSHNSDSTSTNPNSLPADKPLIPESLSRPGIKVF